MRINEPNTTNEVMLSDDSMIVSKTDLKGIITMVNGEFIRISGYSEDELIGKNHNLVRHPDMPPAAFQNLWDTIQDGKPWTGLVKNRCKNGDFYWVRANVTPIFRGGRIVEFMSVRSKPGRAEVEAAGKLYQQIGKGDLPKPGIWQRLNIMSKMRIWQKLAASTVGAMSIIGLLSVALVYEKNHQIQTYVNEQQGLEYITSVRKIMQDMPQHRGMSNAYLNGNTSLKDKILAKRAAVDREFEALAGIDRKYNGLLDTSSTFAKIREKWNTLKNETFKLKAPVAFARHTALLEELISLNLYVADNSNLNFDEHIDSSYLIDLVVNRIPVITEKMGQSRGLGAGVVAAGGFKDGQKERLIKLQVLSDLMTAGIARSLDAAFKANGELKASLGNEAGKLKQGLSSFAKEVDKVLAGRFNELNSTQFFNAGTAAINQAFAVNDAVVPQLNKILVDREEAAILERNITFTIVIVAFTLMTGLGAYVIKGIVDSLKSTAEEFIEIANGNYKRDIDINRADEVGDLLRSLKSMQIKLGFDVNDARTRADEMQRIKVALDNVSGNVMMADTSRHIIYMNKAVTEMMRNAQSDVRKELPNFDVDKLVGGSIDDFHKNPAHQKQMLESLTTTYSTRIEIGGRTFDLSANPVVNDKGERLGTAVEWLDRTAEVAVEEEIEAIVSAARDGDLDKRLDVSNKEGFFRELSEGINQLISVVNDTFMDVARTMGVMAEGDLTQKITNDYQGTYGQVKDNINRTIDRLQEVVGNIRASSEFIRSSSEEISTGNNNLSQRAEEQASTLEETASSMEELTGTVKNNADSAQQANQLASSARTQAEKGGSVVKDAVAAMQEITSSSQKISEIISVIDEIAFQTNLLALNASVEAARAGEQGRGFAVVATEVRNLAGRSATAAKEIKDLITDSAEKVENGSKLVNESGETLNEIVVAVKKVVDIISEIAAASAEQSAGIDQINKAVSQMDEMTQQNAALAEEASAASEASAEKANEMNRLVSFFKT